MANNVEILFNNETVIVFVGVYNDIGFILMQDKSKRDSIKSTDELKVMVNSYSMYNLTDYDAIEGNNFHTILDYVDMEYAIFTKKL